MASIRVFLFTIFVVAFVIFIYGIGNFVGFLLLMFEAFFEICYSKVFLDVSGFGFFEIFSSFG